MVLLVVGLLDFDVEFLVLFCVDEEELMISFEDYGFLRKVKHRSADCFLVELYCHLLLQ